MPATRNRAKLDSNLMPPVGYALVGWHDAAQRTSIEPQFGRTVDWMTQYNPTMTALITTGVPALHTAGYVVRIDWPVRRYEGDVFGTGAKPYTDFYAWVAAGNMDLNRTVGGKVVYGLNAQIDALKALDRKVWLSIQHEFDDANSAVFGSQANFRKMWRYIVDKIVSRGARGKVVVYWNGVGNVSKLGTALTDDGVADSNGMYPGHRYVDVLGMDDYNWYTNTSSATDNGRPWQTWVQTMAATVNWWKGQFKVGGRPTLAQVTGTEGVYKPMLIGETACPERQTPDPPGTTPSGPAGDRRDWLNDAATALASGGVHSEIIKGFMWFGTLKNDAGRINDWRILSGTPGWLGVADIGTKGVFNPDPAAVVTPPSGTVTPRVLGQSFGAPAAGNDGNILLTVPTGTTAGKTLVAAFSVTGGSAAILSPPGVERPSGLTATAATTGGTLAAGTYSYRVSATDAAGETIPCAAVTATTTGSTGSVALSWSPTKFAAGYKVYGRTAAGELLMATLTGQSSTTWTDTGATTPAGARPTVNTTATRWLHVGTRASSGATSTDVTMDVWAMTATADDAPGAARTWYTDAGAGRKSGGVMFVLEGVKPTDLIAQQVSATALGVTTINAPAVTTTAADRRLLTIVGGRISSGTATWAWPAAVTALGNASGTAGTGVNGLITAGTVPAATAAAYGPYAATLTPSVAGATANLVAMTIAVKAGSAPSTLNAGGLAVNVTLRGARLRTTVPQQSLAVGRMSSTLHFAGVLVRAAATPPAPTFSRVLVRDTIATPSGLPPGVRVVVELRAVSPDGSPVLDPDLDLTLAAADLLPVTVEAGNWSASLASTDRLRPVGAMYAATVSVPGGTTYTRYFTVPGTAAESWLGDLPAAPPAGSLEAVYAELLIARARIAELETLLGL